MRRLKLNTLHDLSFKDKNVFMRVDFNVPMRDGEVIHTLRLRKALPSIRFILERGGKLLLASHLGRPGGRIQKKYSLFPVAQALSDISGLDVVFVEDVESPLPNLILRGLRPDQVILLQNLRFHPGEESQDMRFAKHLAGFTHIYVNEGFGIAHRKHASVTLLPDILPQKALGLQFEREMKMLDRLKSPSPDRRPFCVILGGSKLADKFPLMEALMDSADEFLVGGLIAYTFLKAMGRSTGKSFVDSRFVSRAKEFMERAQLRDKKIFLPVDHIAENKIGAFPWEKQDLPAESWGGDIGPRTLNLFKERISKARSVFWNGPMGFFEKPDFRVGTLGLAERLANCSEAFRLVGGGHSAMAVGKYEKDFDYVSTGGGAALAYLKDSRLPGLNSLISPAPSDEEAESSDEAESSEEAESSDENNTPKGSGEKA